MRRTFLIVCLSIMALTLHAQKKELKKEGNVYSITDISASPVGGFGLYQESLSKSIKYPEEARKGGIEGQVLIELIIDKIGELASATVLKGIGHGCDEMALNAVKKCGRWSPGLVAGKPVKQKIILPVEFALGKKSRVDSNH